MHGGATSRWRSRAGGWARPLRPWHVRGPLWGGISPPYCRIRKMLFGSDDAQRRT